MNILFAVFLSSFFCVRTRFGHRRHRTPRSGPLSLSDGLFIFLCLYIFFPQSSKVGYTMWIEDVMRREKTTQATRKKNRYYYYYLIYNNSEKATERLFVNAVCGVRFGNRYSYSWHAVRLILFIRLLFLRSRLQARARSFHRYFIFVHLHCYPPPPAT